MLAVTAQEALFTSFWRQRIEKMPPLPVGKGAESGPNAACRPWEYSAHSFDLDRRHGVAPIVSTGVQVADAVNPGMNMHETFAAGIG